MILAFSLSDHQKKCHTGISISFFIAYMTARSAFVLLITPLMLIACNGVTQSQVDDLVDGMQASSAMMEGKMDASKMQGVAMMDGEMVTLWVDNKAMQMKNDMMMPNGMNVEMNGTVTKADGTKVTMKDGEAMMMDGS
jgi:hypothetical protein